MSRITTCPRCATRLSVSEGITEKTLICPHCLANVENSWSGSQIRLDDINTDVKRDVDAGCIAIAVLIGFCVVGIALAFSVGGNSGIPILGWSCAVLDLLVCFAIIRRRHSRAQGSSVASTCGTAFLVLGTTVAIFIFFFFGCASMFTLKL